MTDAIKLSIELGYTNLPEEIVDKKNTPGSALFDKTHISPSKAQTLFKQAQGAAQELLAVLSDKTPRGAPAPLGKNGAPELPLPKISLGAEGKLDSNAKFTYLLGQAMVLLANVSLQELANRLEISVANSAALRHSNTELAKQFQQAVTESQAAYDKALGDMDALQQAKTALETQRRVYQQAGEALGLLSPEDEGYVQAQQALSAAENELKTAGEHMAKAQAKADASYQVANDKAQAVDDLYGKMQLTGSQQSLATKEHAEQALDAMARMMLLIGIFITLVDKNSQQALESDAELFQRIQVAVQQDLKNQADKAAAEMRKADELNKAMGCVGKILGGLITALSVIGAAFSGGASLAFAAVGLALMVGDQIGKAITGVSFMEKILNPIMEKVIQPLVEALSKGITQMLEKMGVDSTTANMVGNIVGALVAVALIIAVVVVGKAAASKFASSALGKMIGEAIKKIVPDVLKNLANKSGMALSDGMKRLMDRLGLKSDTATLQKYSNNLNAVNVGATVTTTGVQGGLGVARGVAEKNAQDILAGFTLSASVLDQIKKLLETLLDNFSESQKNIQQKWADLSEIQMNAAGTNNMILRNTFA
ncbi:type III secretion system translocon subunit SctE [Sodalis sp. RH21]|uniref:type III secretion system translocon subunit SctE n=1 Tax=unclassified Sodalis (in: enterobacteria) TaxID=2636512 RepID=UPI0039B4B8A5